VPRRTKTIFPRAVIESHLKRSGAEIFEWTPAAPNAPARPRVKGWRWECGCAAFAHPADAALWIPCAQHAPLLDDIGPSEPS
jgi:hypothetical protein